MYKKPVIGYVDFNPIGTEEWLAITVFIHPDAATQWVENNTGKDDFGTAMHAHIVDALDCELSIVSFQKAILVNMNDVIVVAVGRSIR